MHVGDQIPTFEFGPVTRTDIVRYAGAGGDFNPMHHDDELTRSAGLPGVFSMGMFQGGVLAQRLAQWVGRENVTRLRLRFTGQVWPGDVVTITGSVTAIDGAEATCELEAVNQDGGRVLKADA